MGWTEKFTQREGRPPNYDDREARKRKKLEERAAADRRSCTLELRLTTMCSVSGKLSFEVVTGDPMAEQQTIIHTEHGRPKTSLKELREKISKRFCGAPAPAPVALPTACATCSTTPVALLR